MRFCLSCYRLSTSGLYCGHCGRSFGGRLCKGKKKHLNPPDAQFCSQCGSDKLTDPTVSLPLGWLTLALVGGCCWLFWRLTLPWMWPVLVMILDRLLFALLWVGLIYALLTLIPGEVGRQLRRLFSSVIKLLSQEGTRLIKSLIKAVFRLIGIMTPRSTKH